jgi:hypothetical protein
LPKNWLPQDIVARWKTTTFGGIGKPKTAALILTHRAETGKNRRIIALPADGVVSLWRRCFSGNVTVDDFRKNLP